MRLERLSCTASDDRLASRVIAHEAHGQFIATLDGWHDALLCLQVLRGDDAAVACAAIRAFGVDQAELAALESRWRELMTRIFDA